MKKIIKKFKILILIYITFTAIATYFSIYLPIRNVLKENALDNFILQIKYEKGLIEQYISLYNEYSVILSTDFNMMDDMNSYIKGEFDRQTLGKKLETKYKAHASQMNHLLSATRFIDNEPISVYNEISLPDQNSKQNSTTMKGTIIYNDNIIYKVYSPILNEYDLIGYDVLIFNVSSIVESFEDDNYNVKFVEPNSSKEVLLNKFIYSKDNINLYNSGKKIIYVGRVANTEAFLYYDVYKSDLYTSIKRITLNILISCVISLIVITTLTNLFVVKNANKLLTISENSKEMYKQFAIKDPLSGAYSRLFFENWLENQTSVKDDNSPFHYTLVIIDVDNFKTINDSYGHLDGDKAIKAISSVLLSTVRTTDYVIRYGGDEFLIIFNECTEQQARVVMLRIEDKLKKIDSIDFEITISYGIHEVVSRKDILDAISKADQKMYEVKKNKIVSL